MCLVAAPFIPSWRNLICLSSNEPSIITLTETWLTPSVGDAEIYLNHFTALRADHGQTRRSCGGVALYIKSSRKPVRLQLDIEASPCIEMIYCMVSTFPTQTTILAVYRSPNYTSSDEYLFFQAIQHAATAREKCLFIGDFNAPPC